MISAVDIGLRSFHLRREWADQFGKCARCWTALFKDQSRCGAIDLVDLGLRPAAAWQQHAYSTVKQTPSDFNNLDRFGSVAACSAYILRVSLSLLFLLFW